MLDKQDSKRERGRAGAADEDMHEAESRLDEMKIARRKVNEEALGENKE